MNAIAAIELEYLSEDHFSALSEETEGPAYRASGAQGKGKGDRKREERTGFPWMEEQETEEVAEKATGHYSWLVVSAENIMWREKASSSSSWDQAGYHLQFASHFLHR